jgi:hypothetical protein
MTAKWQTINGVRYPVDGPDTTEETENPSLPRGYWRARREWEALTVKRSSAVSLSEVVLPAEPAEPASVEPAPAKPVEPTKPMKHLFSKEVRSRRNALPCLELLNTCHWCGDDDVAFVKSYGLFGCRECASECGED